MDAYLIYEYYTYDGIGVERLFDVSFNPEASLWKIANLGKAGASYIFYKNGSSIPCMITNKELE